MQAAPIRFANAALWPLTIWFSLRHFNEHPADDYVESASSIAAFAVGFWIVAACVAGLWFANGPKSIFDVLLFFLPVIYAIGFWMFTSREEKYSR